MRALSRKDVRRLFSDEVRRRQLATEAFVTDKSGGGSSESFFLVWAEENASLGAANTYEWAFGNGGNGQATEGLMMLVPSGYTCTCVAMGLTLGGSATASATVELVVNGVPQGAACQVVVAGTGQGIDEIAIPLPIMLGDRITFRTVSSSGTGSACQVDAWLKMVKS